MPMRDVWDFKTTGRVFTLVEGVHKEVSRISQRQYPKQTVRKIIEHAQQNMTGGAHVLFQNSRENYGLERRHHMVYFRRRLVGPSPYISYNNFPVVAEVARGPQSVGRYV